MAFIVGGVCNALALAFGLWLAYTCYSVIYNLYFHPLRRFPGPLLMRISRLPYIYEYVRGVFQYRMTELHQQYGEIVRIAPDELAFSNPAAWNDIQGHRTKGQPEMEKSNRFYRPVDGVVSDIVNADREEHSMLRRTLAHGFSEKSLRDQQPMIGQYVDLLIKRLHEECGGGSKPLDLAAWYNYTTFDVIGDLAFGEPFGCLEQGRYHSWVSTIFKLAKVGTIVQSMAFFAPIKKLMDTFAPIMEKMSMQRQDFLSLSIKKLEIRMTKFKERPDLVEPMLKRADEWGLTMEKLQANSSLLIIAGSETTATLLSGMTYFIMTNPDVLKKLIAEVRNMFKSQDDINFISVNELTYLGACISESLRMYPPVGNGLPRIVPAGGATVCGQHIAGGTTVSVHHYAVYHQPSLFRDPNEFHPERWLGDPKYADDTREALQPFHVGPRNCIGRNLAYVEMKTIMARVLWNFDIHIAEESRNFIKQKNFNLWEKGVLMTYLKPVVR